MTEACNPLIRRFWSEFGRVDDACGVGKLLHVSEEWVGKCRMASKGACSYDFTRARKGEAGTPHGNHRWYARSLSDGTLVLCHLLTDTDVIFRPTDPSRGRDRGVAVRGGVGSIDLSVACFGCV